MSMSCLYGLRKKLASENVLSRKNIVFTMEQKVPDYLEFPPVDYEPTVLNTLLANALDLTAPASDALVKNRKNTWVQLAGHPGSFAPAGPNTIWKKRLSKDNNETMAYQALMNDIARDIVPKFYREVEYNAETFIEIEDLLQKFHDPNVMDIKMGTRTFLESEVKNPILRTDLYEKMMKLDPTEPTATEHEQKAITKLRYMQFREKGSSTSTLGFRIEAMKKSGDSNVTDLKKLKEREEVTRSIGCFLSFDSVIIAKLLRRAREMRQKFECSKFFKTHEVIGSSILVLYDKEQSVGVWMIDFAKTLLVDHTLTHRAAWQVGNHEDGYLTGLDSFIEVLIDLEQKSTDRSYVSAALEQHHNTCSGTSTAQQSTPSVTQNTSSCNTREVSPNHTCTNSNAVTPNTKRKADITTNDSTVEKDENDDLIDKNKEMDCADTDKTSNSTVTLSRSTSKRNNVDKGDINIHNVDAETDGKTECIQNKGDV